MKKTIIKTVAFAVAATATLASCSKEIPDSQETTNGAAVFTAELDDLSKTTLVTNGTVGKVNWVEGDVVYINGAEYTATPDASDATKAVLTAKSACAETIDGKYYASYGFDGSVLAGVVSGTLPSTQAYDPTIGNVPMYAESTTTSLVFKNLAAVLEINLNTASSIKSVTVATTEPNSGDFSISALGTDTPLTLAETASKTVTVDCGEGVAPGTDGVKVYVALAAGSYSGLTVTVTRADGATWSVSSDSVDPIVMKASTIYPLTFTPEFKLVLAKWRFKPDLTFTEGNGFSWCGQRENPGSVVWNVSYEEGERGYFTATMEGSGKLSYVQMDKTGWTPELHPDDSDKGRYYPGLAIRGGDNGGQPMMTAPWKGDYWQFETTGNANLKAGDKVHMFYTYASESYAAAYWLVEYKDGNEWKPALPVSETTISIATPNENIEYNFSFPITTGTKGYDYNQDVDFTVTLQNDNPEFVVRMVCCSNFQANTKWFAYPNNKIVHRIAGTGSANHPFPFIEKL